MLETKLTNMGENVSSMIAPRHEVNNITSLRLCDEVYSSIDNPNVNKSACSALQNVRYRQSFQSKALGTSALLNIPNVDIVKFIIVSVNLNVTLNAGKSVGAGWLYDMIDKVQWTLGGGQTWTLGGSMLRNYLLLCLANREKKADFVNAGGEYINASGTYGAEIVLHVPGLTQLPDEDVKSLGFDARLLTNISQVIIYWKTTAQAFNSMTTGAPVASAEFDNGEFVVVNDVWTDSALSLANVMRMDQSAEYIQPFSFLQSFSVNMGGETVGVEQWGPVITKTISGFRYGNLTGIIFNIEDPNLYSNVECKIQACEVDSVSVLYNGVALYNCPGQVLKLIQASTNTCYQAVQVDEGINGTKYPITQPLNAIQFSLLDVAKNSSVVQQGLQIGNNSLQLSFRCKKYKNAGIGAGTGTTAQFSSSAILNISYVYDCGLVVKQSGARVDYYF